MAVGSRSGSTYTIPGVNTAAGAQLVCTFTNARQPALRLQKQLPLGRYVASDQFTLGIAGAGGPVSISTTGSGTTATGTAAISVAAAGTVYTLSETATSGAVLSNYAATYNCSNAYSSGTAVPSGTGSNFSVTPQLGDDLTCTFINTRSPLADLGIIKTNFSDGSNPLVVGANTTYRLTITNNGPDAVTGAIVTDQPQSGLSCPGGNAVTCSGPGCAGAMSASLTVGALVVGGITLGTQPTGAANATTLTFTCQVQ